MDNILLAFKCSANPPAAEDQTVNSNYGSLAHRVLPALGRQSNLES